VDARLILVVDGDVTVRQSLIDLLSLEGFEVDGAEDAEAALLLLEQRRYDLVIADVRMPALDGPTLIAALNERFADSPPRVVFLTGQTFDPQYGGFLADLRAPMLMKPLRPGPALQLIGRVLVP
jgi:DNA-binding response OmpR family regulator